MITIALSSRVYSKYADVLELVYRLVLETSALAGLRVRISPSVLIEGVRKADVLIRFEPGEDGETSCGIVPYCPRLYQENKIHTR